jgi:hypothetical protein
MQKWSHSLDVAVRTCERQVFYAARFANPTAAKGSPRHEAFLLSQARDFESWRGALVHSVIDQLIVPALARGERFRVNKFQGAVNALIDRQAAFSASGKYRYVSKNAEKVDHCVLAQHLNGVGVSQAQIEQVRTEVFAALHVLETNYAELLDRICRARERYSEREIRWRLDDQILVEAIPDLILIEKDSHAVIIDWKVWSGERTNARDQLHAYAFVIVRCGYWPTLWSERVELIEANLLTGESITYSITEDELDLVDERIFLGSEKLKPIFARLATECSPDDFAPATSPQACLICPVKEICSERVSAKPKTEQMLIKLF